MAKTSTKELMFTERDRHNLKLAIRSRKVGRITKILDQKNSVIDLHAILHYAVSYNQTEVVSLLITRYKCPVDCRNDSKFKETPLHVACERGSLPMIRMLMEHGADPNTCNEKNDTPLHVACRSGNLDVVRLLMEHGADLLARNEENDTPLHRAALNGNTNIILCLIDDFKCCPAIKGSDGTTILHQACSAGHVELAEVLLTRYNQSLDPMSADDHGNTPLHHATLNGSIDTVKLLIKCKCPIDCKNKDKQTPLHYACVKGHLNVVRILVSEDNTSAIACDINGYNPLRTAAICGHANIVEFLVEFYNMSSSVEENYDLKEQHCLELQSTDKVEMKNRHCLLQMLHREGYACKAQCTTCIVQLPCDTSVNVEVEHVDAVTLHPKLLAKEFLLTPVVHISSDTKVFSSDKQIVIELLKIIEFKGGQTKPIPLFSDTHPSQPPDWHVLKPDDLGVFQDRIVFNTTHVGLFTVITRLPTTVTNSIKVTPNRKAQEQIELTLQEVPNLKVVIYPSSIRTDSEAEIKMIANFDHHSFSTRYDVTKLDATKLDATELDATELDATACITLEPHGLEVEESNKIQVELPIPEYAKITTMCNDARLQFLYLNDPLDIDRESAQPWTDIPENECKIVTTREGKEYVGIISFRRFSSIKAVWRNIPGKLKKTVQGPIHEFRKWIAKKLVKSSLERCQVFMSKEVVVGNCLTFTVTALLHPISEDRENPRNYPYMLDDSQDMPLVIKGSNVKLTFVLADHYCKTNDDKNKTFCDEIELSDNLDGQAFIDIELDSSVILADEAKLGNLFISHGDVKPHKRTLIKVITFMAYIIVHL